MIYFLYLLSIVFLLLILFQFKLKSFTRPAPLVFSKPNALEHDDLLILFDKFNYKHSDGICHGFTLTWAQEAAYGLDHQFYNRLNLIKKEKTTLAHSVETISQKIKSSRTLSAKEQHLNEVKPFLEAICLAQSPEDYQDIYAQAMQQSNINIIYKMIQLNFYRNQNTIKSLFCKTMSLASPQEVSDFLIQLYALLPEKNPVIVVFSSEEHTIGFKKHKDRTWLFVDINYLYEQSERYPYQLLSSKELSATLYQSLFESTEQLVFNCSFVAKSGQRKLPKQLKALDDLYPLHAKDISTQNCRGYGILTLAVQADDRNTVNNILRIHKKKPVISLAELGHALYFSATCNRPSIMSQLLNLGMIDINSPYNEIGDTLLGIACKYGSTGIVQLLLDDETVQVNTKNAKGMTPLMLAAQASAPPALFARLLGAKADVSLRNDQGQTAYDIAQTQDNQTAMTALIPYISKAGPKTGTSSSFKKPQVKRTGEPVFSFSNQYFFNEQDKVELKVCAENSLTPSLD